MTSHGSETPDPQGNGERRAARVLRLVMGFAETQIVLNADELGVFDLLRDGPWAREPNPEPLELICAAKACRRGPETRRACPETEKVVPFLARVAPAFREESGDHFVCGGQT